jgi:uncharacterized protein YjbI with pentapeptide repeats
LKARLSYAESFARLAELAGADGRPRPDVTARPRHDDDDYGPSLFRTLVEDCALQRLTIPGLFIGRSELRRVDLSHSDLRLGNFAWNDFTTCWFTRADLTDSDLRGSQFVDCDFSSAILAGSDFRHSSFSGCRFRTADTTGIRVPERLRPELKLSPEQVRSAIWVVDEGPEPPGG